MKREVIDCDRCSIGRGLDPKKAVFVDVPVEYHPRQIAEEDSYVEHAHIHLCVNCASEVLMHTVQFAARWAGATGENQADLGRNLLSTWKVKLDAVRGR